MKVLHVAWQPEGYGIGTLLRDLVTCQNGPQGGVRADILFHSGGQGAERFAGTGGSVTALGASSARDLRLLPRLYGAMKGYDAVILHTPSPWALFAARARGVRTIYLFHGATGGHGGAGAVLRRVFQRHVLQRLADMLVFASHASCEKYRRAFGAPAALKTALFPYGLSVRDVRARRKREEVRSDLGLEGAFAVGTAARLAPEKAVERLIETASFLPKEKKWAVVIAGSGRRECEESLRSRVRERALEEDVRFLGYRDDCRDVISALDFFVLPSREEPFGLALLEAMALGIPAAAFEDGGGAVEILGDGGHTAREPRGLARFIASVRNDGDLAADLSRRGRARAKELDVSHMAERLREILS